MAGGDRDTLLRSSERRDHGVVDHPPSEDVCHPPCSWISAAGAAPERSPAFTKVGVGEPLSDGGGLGHADAVADDAHAQPHTGVEQDGPQTRVAALQCTDDRITLADRAKPAPIDIETPDPFDSSRARPAISLGVSRSRPATVLWSDAAKPD